MGSILEEEQDRDGGRDTVREETTAMEDLWLLRASVSFIDPPLLFIIYFIIIFLSEILSINTDI